jgi:hypothetical protein
VVKITRLSCYRFRSNEVRLALSLLAYNLGNLWLPLALPKRIENWSLTSLQAYNGRRFPSKKGNPGFRGTLAQRTLGACRALYGDRSDSSRAAYGPALGLARLLTYAMLPVYMFHQVEEHTGDRFRIFVNEKVFGGVEALSHDSVLWISLPGVWGVGLLSVYAATFVGPGWGLSMVCLVLVNSVAHLVGSGCVAPIQSRILDNPSPLHPGRHLGAGENFQRVRRGPDTPCRWHGCGHRNPCRHCYLYEAAESKNCGTRQIHGVSVARAKIRGFLASS